MANDPVWSDDLDDTSHVLIPIGGLVGVEVTGGEARLLPGYSEGWLASEAIPCPPDHRYDLVLVEADTPGTSKALITVLDPSKEPSEVGFANETIPGYVKQDARDVDVFSLSRASYPSVRIQVNLVASGADRPRLLSWSLMFINLGEWRDDMLGTSKMSEGTGIEVANGSVGLNLLSGNLPKYDPYPPIMLAADWGSGNGGIDAFFANAQGNGYADKVTITSVGAYGFDFEDLNNDTYLDMVCAQYGNGGNADSDIYWGSSSGTWSRSSVTEINTYFARDAGTGDFDGDGDPDVVIANGRPSGGQDSRVFLNRGGTFQNGADVSLSTEACRRVATGDLNGDEYDDIVFAEEGTSRVYFGGSGGPDTTADRSLSTPGITNDVVVRDLDGDSYLDVAFTSSSTSNALVFLGGPTGPDTTADFNLAVGGEATGIDAADINGDGYLDLCLSTGSTVKLFEGRSSGWSASFTRSVTTSAPCTNVRCADINRDGYSDIVAATTGASTKDLQVFLGRSGWPAAADITKVGGNEANNIGIAIPKVVDTGFQGSFVTAGIDLPDDTKKWDLLLMRGTVPENATMTVSILDINRVEIPGYEAVTDWDVDISGIAQDRIYVKVMLKSRTNESTPTIDMISVKWMDRMTWREQFFGHAKIERVLNAAVVDDRLESDVRWYAGGPQELLFTSVRGDGGYDTQPVHFTLDSHALDMPTVFEPAGTSAAAAGDVNGDGLTDVAFAVHRTSDTTYKAKSALYLGTPMGFGSSPSHEFPTVGATDVLIEDLDGDGHEDVMFAQEYDGYTYAVNSTLFWGGDAGWNTTPDIEFATHGATGVVAADLDGDGDLDLAFACYRDDSTTSRSSLVFLQSGGTFDGAAPDHQLPTRGARAVDAGDIDGDGRADLVFANSFQGGSTEISSFVYWGKAGGGFETTPTGLATVGAEDVRLVRWDTDARPDIAFANKKDNGQDHEIDSYVYINDGTRSSRTAPDVRLPTVGASAVDAIDLGSGATRQALAFACEYNGTSFETPSVVYVATRPGAAWTLPVEGASGVLASPIMPSERLAYESRPIKPEDWTQAGGFHTLRYTTTMSTPVSGRLRLVDAATREVLAETALGDGSREWVVDRLFSLKDHPSIRLQINCSGVGSSVALTIDDLWLNWTLRSKRPPSVLGIDAVPQSLLRMRTGSLRVDVADEYNAPAELTVSAQHRPNGTTAWDSNLLGTPSYVNGSWVLPVYARADATVGMYDIRVDVVDSDGDHSGFSIFPSVLEIRNNVPTTPVVRIMPEAPLTTTSLRVEMLAPASDVETGVSYRYAWYRDGALVEGLALDTVASTHTSKGENWSVEVRAFDGIDEGPPALAWVIIRNAPPQVAVPLPDPELPEDTVDDRWLDLGRSFSDPDGDALTYTLTRAPANITVTIDPATGVVTLTPARDWHGQETATFVASDGELTQTQTVLITVTPVNDAPRFTTLNGEPITTDPAHFEVEQGGLLVIAVGSEDVEGDRLVFSVNTTAVEVDPDTGEMRFQPGNDVVGTVRYAITMYDEASQNVKVRLNITITVVNVNDPPGEARVTNPRPGDKFKANTTFSLIGTCTDPDTPYGQVLNYTWYWNGTNRLGHGSSLTVKFDQAGNYTITLNVTDGEYFREASVTIEVLPKETPAPPPPPPPPKEEEGLGVVFWIGILVILVVIGGVVFLVMGRRRAVEEEQAEEVDEQREALMRMAAAAKETAERMEREVAESRAERAAAPRAVELEEIRVEGMGGPSAKAGLSMDMQLSEQASREVQALFAVTPAAAVPTEDSEAMRLESLKRKYQTAISCLPYGIPSEALKDREWPWLAGALATGERKTLPDGREVTRVEGRWYYSDVRDASSFLKEHGAKPKAQPMRVVPAEAAPTVDRETLLAKLEERFILGEISERAYEELKRKYEGTWDRPGGGGHGAEWKEEG